MSAGCKAGASLLQDAAPPADEVAEEEGPTMLGEQIRERRERFGFSVEAVADLAGLPVGRVRAVEAGQATTVFETNRLGDALAFNPAALRRGDPLEDPRRSVARFRSPEGVRALPAHDARLLAQASGLGRIGAHLADVLGLPRSRIHELRAVRGVDPSRDPWREGYELGEAARLRLAPERDPIPSVQRLLEGLGVHVAVVRFQAERIHAVSLREPSAMPVVLLNGEVWRVRDRLSRRAILAHELCHLLHDGGERDLLTLVSQRAERSRVEKRAGGFAPSFLAPRRWVSPTKVTPPAIVRELAFAWGFSFEGSAWHAANLDLVPEREASRLAKLRGPEGTSFEPPVERLPVPDLDVPVEPSPLVHGLVADLAVRAYHAGEISTGRTREILRFQ